MLKKIRKCLAAVVFVLITLLFLDFTGTLHAYLGWMAKVQLLPAVLALNFAVIALLAVLTFVFGRIYCSVICPLGILQDLLARFNKKKNKYSYSPAKTWLRWTMVVVLVGLLVAGLGAFAGIIAPYSSFGRIAQNLLSPIYLAANNLLAAIAEHYQSYAFYEKEIWIRSMPTFVIAAITLVVLAVLAFRGGRTYCNTICPVGTVLGFISRYSIFKIAIDKDKCKKCRKCERNCKASCIDIKTLSIDYSRCVACGNCIDNCLFDAIKYKPMLADASLKAQDVAEQKAEKATANSEGGHNAASAESVANGRREFLVGAGLALGGVALAQEKKKVDGGLAIIEDKIQPERNTKLTPPGSLSAKNLQNHCTACQLCVSECPNDVLIPSTDIKTLMQPTMSYERGFCRPECNRCSSVCPTGAIKPITLADKSSTQIGHAVWVKKNCICVTDGIDCGNCARHCPAGAIQMVALDGDETLPMVPVVNEARCIGCGACENLCPARPFSAIYVEGHEVHKTI